MGGGGQAATITMPDTGAYDRMANMQMQAMRDQMNGQTSLQQAKLNAALSDQQGVMTQLADVKTQRANDTAANAARLAALIGTPPPEKTASAPTVGTNRSDVAKASGKKGLRIERSTPTTQAAGTGLNITTGA
jgi:cell division septation protein DedD